MERKMNTSRLKERYESPTVEKCQVMLEQMMAGSKYTPYFEVAEEWTYEEVSGGDINIDF
ncbi:hypothetical protein [Phocaeicola sp.]|jgi:hypothetical protein